MKNWSYIGILVLILLFSIYGVGAETKAMQSMTVNVPSDGSPSKGISLQAGRKYSIVVYGIFQYKGKNSKADACQAFYPQNKPVMFAQNSLGVLLDCSNPRNNTYESKPFIAKKGAIRFYISDTYYSDNRGRLKAFVYDLGARNNPSSGGGGINLLGVRP